VGIFEQRSELLAVFSALPARVLIDVLVDDLVTCAPLAQLPELVLRVLAFVVS
jgi:hypothetical protein